GRRLQLLLRAIGSGGAVAVLNLHPGVARWSSTVRDPATAGPHAQKLKPDLYSYFAEADGSAKTLAAARWVAVTHGAGQAPMPTTPTMQMRIARARSGATLMRPVCTG